MIIKGTPNNSGANKKLNFILFLIGIKNKGNMKPRKINDEFVAAKFII